MDMKRCEETMREMAGDPSEEEIKSLRVFGLPAIKFSKKFLLYALLHLVKEQEKKRKEHMGDIEFLTSLRRR